MHWKCSKCRDIKSIQMETIRQICYEQVQMLRVCKRSKHELFYTISLLLLYILSYLSHPSHVSSSSQIGSHVASNTIIATTFKDFEYWYVSYDFWTDCFCFSNMLREVLWGYVLEVNDASSRALCSNISSRN